MKIIFEHGNRKTTVVGTDYNSIVDKIRSIFSDQNDKPIQFYDPELTDYFEFTSFEQINDQANGIKMKFDMLNTSDSSINSCSLSSSLNNDVNKENSVNSERNTRLKRCRKRKEIELDDTNHVPIILPTYCNLIIQGLESQESFPSIKKIFLEQTCTHFLQQYPNSLSKSLHYSFVTALAEKYPTLKYLNKDDRSTGKTPYHTISSLISKKKRNTKYSKTHRTPKRPRLSTIDLHDKDKTNEQVVINETTTSEPAGSCTIPVYNENNLLDQSSLNDLHELLNESNPIEPVVVPSDQTEQAIVHLPLPKQSIQLPAKFVNHRQATFSSVPPANPPIINASIDTKIVSIKPTITTTPILTARAPTALIYHAGRMKVTPVLAISTSIVHLDDVSSQSIVSVHKAIAPRDTTKKQTQNQTNNCTDATTNIKEAQQNVLRPISIDNIEKPKISTNEEEIWYPKLSKSEQSAYNKDVSRLRIVVKPKTKSTQHASISEIHALIRNSHRIRRRMLSQNQDTDFTKKVFQYQEIFHEEALHGEYSLLKNKLCSLEELEDEARLLLNDIIGKHSVHQQDQMSETDFIAMQLFCEEFGEQNIFFKNGLVDPHPTLGILIMPSVNKEFEKAFMFIRNLSYKMSVSIGGGGLHKILALILITYINLNHPPTHKLLQKLSEHCKQKFNENLG